MESVPNTPPDSVEDALNWADVLDSADAGQREKQLNHLSRSSRPSSGAIEPENRVGQPTWSDFLHSFFPDDQNDFSVRTLLRTLRDMGISKPDSIKHISTFLDRTSLQTALASWKQITDRDELRLRLKVLVQCETISPDLCSFLTFFFRSSNPLLYREAALAIGSHISASASLRDYVESFAEQRNLDPYVPIELNGERNRRRLLLVRAGALIHGQPMTESDHTELPFTFHADEPIQSDQHWLRTHLPEDPSDLSILYDVIGLLYQNSPAVEHVRSLVPSLLNLLIEHENIRLTRSLLKRWGFVLAEFTQREETNSRSTSSSNVASPASLWFRMRKRILNRPTPTDGMAVHMKMYMFWNELIRTLLRFPSTVRTNVVRKLMEDDPSSGSAFDLLRLRTWAFREHRALETVDEMDRFLDEHITSDAARPLQLAYKSLNIAIDSRPSPIDHPASDQLDVLERMLEPFTDRDRWRSRPAGLRGLSAFFLMDMTEHTTADCPETVPIFRNAGFSGSFQSGDAPQSSGLKFGTVNLILRLLNWEEPNVSQFIDIYLLHRIESQQVLLALLPSGQKSTILPLLADAFEQFLRMKLYTAEHFDPGRLLLRTCVRNPHPAFYDHLLKRVRGRSYETGSGEPLPVDQWIETIRDEANVVGEDAPSSPEDELSTLITENPERSFQNASLSPILDRLLKTRQRYRTFDEHRADPRDLLQNLLSLIGYSDVGTSPGSRSLLSLAKQLHEEDQKLLQSGYPPWSENDFSTLNTFCKQIDDQFHEHVPRLLPSSLDEIEELEETVEDLVDLLDAVRDQLADSLPLFDQRAFEDITKILTGALVSWVNSFRELHDVWSEHASDGIWNRDLSQLFTVVETKFSSSLSRDLLQTIWADLRTRIESSDVQMDETNEPNERVSPTDPWTKHRKLLDWGLEVTDDLETDAESTELHDLFYDSWSTLLEEAMERGEETRVNALLEDESYLPLCKRPDATPLLNDARTWLFDRYQLPVRSVNPSRGNPIMGKGAQIMGFLAHFSPIWLSLMAGAIFLLDFGEPWTQMARIGDVRGIVITFIVGIASTFLYLFADLRQKVNPCPEDSSNGFWLKRAVRISLFLAGCLLYTFLVVCFFWFLLSRTEEVVQGPAAIGHIVVWTGFALFVGIFLGLLAQEG